MGFARCVLEVSPEIAHQLQCTGGETESQKQSFTGKSVREESVSLGVFFWAESQKQLTRSCLVPQCTFATASLSENKKEFMQGLFFFLRPPFPGKELLISLQLFCSTGVRMEQCWLG